MAKVIGSSDSCMFLVEMGVGPGRANNRDDVALVQYFLNLWFAHPNNAGARAKAGVSLSNVLKVDGLIGPKTKARIMAFQSMMKASGRSLLADGCIDRMRNEDWVLVGDDMGSVYAIFCLNVEIMHLYESNLVHLRYRADYPKRLEPMLMKYVAQILDQAA